MTRRPSRTAFLGIPRRASGTVFWSFTFFRTLLVSLAIATFGALGLSRGQPTSAPIFLNLEGDLWVWRGGSSLTRLTNYGFNNAPVISPDGQWVAYSSTAKGFTQPGSGQPPTNIYILKTTTNKIERIAVQANEVSETNDTKAAYRSDPIWSLDSQSLAWVESNADRCKEALTPYDLMRYELKTRATLRTQIRLPGIDDVCGAQRPESWDANGIKFVGYSYTKASARDFWRYRYGIDGRLLEKTPINQNQYRNEIPNTKTHELYATRAPGGLYVSFKELAGAAELRVRAPAGKPMLVSSSALEVNAGLASGFDVGIAPDGKRVAFIERLESGSWLTLSDGAKKERAVKLSALLRDDHLVSRGLVWGHLSWQPHSR